MAFGKRSTWTEIQELNGVSIWWLYTAIGDPIDKAVRAVIFTNNTDIDIWFSDAPSTKAGEHTDMVKVAPYSSSTWDISTQRSLEDKPLLISVGTQFYARSFWMDHASAGTWVSVSCLTVESGS